MNTNLLLFLLIFSFCGAGSIAQELVVESEAAISCPLYEEKQLSFSDWEKSDILQIHLLGDDCTAAVVSLVIRDSRMRPIFWDSYPLWNLSAYSLKEDGEIERTFKLLKELKVVHSTEAPALDSDCFENEYCYLGPYTDSELYNHIRSKDIPVICVPVHYENTLCYFWKTEEHLTSILYGFGA